MPEIVIIGAGPAGCAAAIELGRSNIPCLLLERGKAGKDKACGDALLPAAVTALAKLNINIEEVNVSNGESFSQIDLMDDEKIIWHHVLPNQTGWVIPRKLFDQRLRNIASRTAKIEYQAIVTELIFLREGQWMIRYKQSGECRSMVCNAVILATGASNAFSWQYGIAGAPLHAVSITTYAEKEIESGLIFQFTQSIEKGYGWVFRCGNRRINTGICALQPDLFNIRQKAESYLQKWGAEQDGNWRGGAGPLWSGKGEKWHGNGLLSCGDAAGLVDPLNGEGISAALVSGREAAKAMRKYLVNERDNHYLAQYSAFIHNHFSALYGDSLGRMIWRKICNM